MRHVQICHNAELPGGRVPFRIAGETVGWLAPPAADALANDASVTAAPDAVTLADPATLMDIARAMVRRGFGRWRDEAFSVRAHPDGPSLALIDRGLLPVFGIAAEGVHVNGLVRRGDGLHLWVARRAADKALDPGKLDHVTAGGVAAGFTPWETLIKEAEEEAAIPAGLAACAVRTGVVSYAMERREGLRRDRLHCYDLDLPEVFVPRAADGEVESFELWPIDRVMQTVHGTDAFKFNVNLVLIDLFLRLDMIAGREADDLRSALATPEGDRRHTLNSPVAPVPG